MKNVDTFIESGILELYVLGQASANEIAFVEEMSSHSAVAREIEAISLTLEEYAKLHAVAPVITP